MREKLLRPPVKTSFICRCNRNSLSTVTIGRSGGQSTRAERMYSTASTPLPMPMDRSNLRPYGITTSFTIGTFAVATTCTELMPCHDMATPRSSPISHLPVHPPHHTAKQRIVAR